MEGNYWERKEELRELQLNFKWMEFQSHVGGGGDGIVLLLFFLVVSSILLYSAREI